MQEPLYQKIYDSPPINRAEILRYARAGEESPEVSSLLDACLAEMDGRLTYRVCWREFPIENHGTFLDLTFAQTTSRALCACLNECESMIVFAATIGLEIDRLINRYGRLAPAKALLFQAIGAERIEALCNCFSREMEEEAKRLGKHTTPRFSPGYGDFPLAVQRNIFSVLDCSRQIGLTLNESLLMSPSKSVTAILGIRKGMPLHPAHEKSCDRCNDTSCIYRRKQ